MKLLVDSTTYLETRIAGKEETHLIHLLNFPADSTTLYYINPFVVLVFSFLAIMKLNVI
jgi:hypothetical protein